MSKKIRILLLAGMILLMGIFSTACGTYDDPAGDDVQDENQQILQELEEDMEEGLE